MKKFFDKISNINNNPEKDDAFLGSDAHNVFSIQYCL